MIHPNTDLECTKCHMSEIPKLNEEGIRFSTSKNEESQKVLELNPNTSNLNASLMFKSRYEKTWDKPGGSGAIADIDTVDGELSVPRSLSGFLGGRMTDNIGALIDASYRKVDKESISAKVIYAQEFNGGYIGSALYSTSSYGPFSGMEVYSTGLFKPQRNFDIMTYSNAFQISSIGTGEVTGLQVYYDKHAVFDDNDHIFATIGVYAPGQDNTYFNLSKNILPLARIAYEYPIGDFNVIIGAFGISGSGSSDSLESLKIERKTYGLDLQIEGEILEKKVQFVASKVYKNEVTFTGYDEGLSSTLTNRLNKAFSVEGTVELTPALGLKLAYLTYDDLYAYPGELNHVDVKDIDKAITVGLDYTFKFYNTTMQVGVEHSWITPTLARVKDYRNFVITFNIML